jgi:hypothetical protein
MEIEYFVEPGTDDEKYLEFKERSENFLKNII